MASDHRFRPYSELLTTEQIRSISGAAARLYAQCWNRMSYRDLTSVVVTNADAAERGRFLMHELQPAQSQLVRAGLLDIAIVAEDRAEYTFLND